MPKKKYLIIFCLAAILLAESVWAIKFTGEKQADPKKQITPDGPKLALSTTDAKIPFVNSQITTQLVILPRSNSIQALDAVIHYDPQKLTPTEIIPLVQIPGSEYPQAKIYPDEGKISVSLVLFDEPITQETPIAQIFFTALTAGQAKIWLDFEYGNTTDSNVVLLNSVNDSLAGVENLNLDIKNAN